MGDLSIENRTARLTVQGDVDLTRDRRGLALARPLKEVLDATVAALEAEEGNLPEEVQVD